MFCNWRRAACHGEISVDIWVSSSPVRIRVVVADISDEGYIGMDFLSTSGALIDCRRGILSFPDGKEDVFCRRVFSEARCCRVTIRRSTTIPAGSELVVPGKIVHREGVERWVHLGPENDKLAKKGLLGVQALVDTETGSCLVLLVVRNR